MGFFSWQCCICHHAVLSPYSVDGKSRHLNEVVLFLDDGRKVQGTYDGYGRIYTDDDELFQIPLGPTYDAEIKLAHQCCAKNIKDIRAYGSSQHEPNQGYFWSKAAVLAMADTVRIISGMPRRKVARKPKRTS
jgi:hypothetical protein